MLYGDRRYDARESTNSSTCSNVCETVRVDLIDLIEVFVYKIQYTGCGTRTLMFWFVYDSALHSVHVKWFGWRGRVCVCMSRWVSVVTDDGPGMHTSFFHMKF